MCSEDRKEVRAEDVRTTSWAGFPVAGVPEADYAPCQSAQMHSLVAGRR